MWNEIAAMIIGFGIAVLAFMLFQPRQPERVIIRHAPRYGYGPWASPGGGPYYAHLPFRPLFY